MAIGTAGVVHWCTAITPAITSPEKVSHCYVDLLSFGHYSSASVFEPATIVGLYVAGRR
ncbi:MAG: hypothetical protein H7201_12850 [Candidatus Saccharibacteria bacterium]|nr:hypothetical protein [Microbacteriaceae bacterium]